MKQDNFRPKPMTRQTCLTTTMSTQIINHNNYNIDEINDSNMIEEINDSQEVEIYEDPFLEITPDWDEQDT